MGEWKKMWLILVHCKKIVANVTLRSFFFWQGSTWQKCTVLAHICNSDMSRYKDNREFEKIVICKIIAANQSNSPEVKIIYILLRMCSTILWWMIFKWMNNYQCPVKLLMNAYILIERKKMRLISDILSKKCGFSIFLAIFARKPHLFHISYNFMQKYNQLW